MRKGKPKSIMRVTRFGVIIEPKRKRRRNPNKLVKSKKKAPVWYPDRHRPSDGIGLQQEGETHIA